MVYAHTLGTGGPEIELILIAGAIAVLGIVFFFQKAVKPVVSVVLIVVAIGAGALAFTMGGGSEGASVTILSPADGDSVPANEPVEITYEIDPGGLPADQLGDVHVYIDGQLQSMLTTDAFEIELEPGTYTVGVEAAQPDHTSFDPRILDEIELTAE